MAQLYIRPGFWIKTKEKVKGALDVRKVFREILTALNVVFYDPCCPASSSPDARTVRYNKTAGHLEYYSISTKTWTAIPAL